MKSQHQRELAQANPFTRSRIRAQAARRPAAGRADFSQHLFRRDVEPWLPDDLPAVQRSARHRLRARVPAAEAGTRLPARSRHAHRHDRIADAGRRFRRDRVLGVVRVGLHQRPHDAASGRRAAARRGSRLHAPAGGDWRRGDVRQPGAAGAVRRRDRRRRRRSAGSGPAPGIRRLIAQRAAQAPCPGARLLHPVVLRR